MRSLGIALTIASVVASASLAQAQRPQGRGFGRGGGDLSLLGQQSVQQELGLSAEQIKQLDEQLDKQREALSDLRDLSREERRQQLEQARQANQGALASLLNEEQLKRFKQISLQQRGGAALADRQVATALDLSDEQKSRLREIQSDAQNEMRSLFQGGAGGGDRRAMRQKLQEARAAANQEMMKVLNSQQQAKWKELVGQPFRGEIRRGRRGPNRGQGDRRRNRDASSN